LTSTHHPCPLLSIEAVQIFFSLSVLATLLHRNHRQR
jgi:hypothetical protein